MGRSSRILKLSVFLLSLLVVGCTQTQSHQSIEGTVKRDADPSVLLMPPDILLQELTASGLRITNAAWTEAGHNNVSQALKISMQSRGLNLTRYQENNPAIQASTLESQQQILKLHGAVGNTILLHKYNQNLSLPTKKYRFDWTLGKEVQSLRDSYKTDYALFVFMRDTFSSGSRVALIFAMAILGVPVSGGYQVGFASLVDLETGDIVWFNLLTSEAGDLRDPARASDAVELLLADLPF